MKEMTVISSPHFGHLRASMSQTFFRRTVQCCLLWPEPVFPDTVLLGDTENEDPGLRRKYFEFARDIHSAGRNLVIFRDSPQTPLDNDEVSGEGYDLLGNSPEGLDPPEGSRQGWSPVELVSPAPPCRGAFRTADHPNQVNPGGRS